jgi:hypothetical protein
MAQSTTYAVYCMTQDSGLMTQDSVLITHYSRPRP